jgi:uncharacterized membrane protein YphA (DoxX/SURF4 family)
VAIVLKWLAIALLSLVFLWAAVPKLIDPAGFLVSIENYRLLPGWLAWWVAIWLPPLELVLALALWVPRTRRSAAVLIALLMLLFTVLLLSAWVRGLDISCGCFGGTSSEAANFPLLLVRDLVLLGAALWVAINPRVEGCRGDLGQGTFSAR